MKKLDVTIDVTIRTLTCYCQHKCYVASEVTPQHNMEKDEGNKNMKWLEDYIDELKERLKLQSDYATAQYLGIPRQSMTKIRNNTALIGHDKCLKIANALKIDPVEIIATVNAQKEKDKDLKAMWIRLAKEKGNQ
ncbi:helix-turn-helix transcriptional regulator [Escherichia coli]|nr:helix-turn-helix transcriptional regulator [Escherichia coli]